jgi:predicted patatin/cPLA2 family phospholipase
MSGAFFSVEKIKTRRARFDFSTRIFEAIPGHMVAVDSKTGVEATYSPYKRFF